MTEKRFLSADDVSAYLGVGRSKAYSVIRELQKELEAKGFLTVRGKIQTDYFLKRFNTN